MTALPPLSDDGARPESGAAAFGRDLQSLFEAAGNPTLTSVVTAVKPIAAVSRQRLSNWRAGRHLPARFADIEPVLAHLIDAAHAANLSTPTAHSITAGADSAAGPSDLLSPEAWELRWESATTAAQSSPAGAVAHLAPTVLYRGLSKPMARIVIGLLVFLVVLLAIAAAVIGSLL